MPFKPSPMSLLPFGTHLGLIESFDDLAGQTDGVDRQSLVEDYRQQSIDAGMTIGRALIDWAELETAPGVFDEDALREALDMATAGGVQAYVTLSTLDSTELTLPDYLEDPDGTVVGDNRLDSDLVTHALEDLIVWMHPILEEYEIFALSLGNEVEFPIEDGTVTLEETTNFFESAIHFIREEGPDYALGLTFNSGATRNQVEVLEALVPLTDVVLFNYGGMDLSGTGDEALWDADFDRMAEAAQGREILLQEWGMSAGYEPGYGEDESFLNTSPELQARFFDYTTQRMIDDPQFRGATLFQLLDWSEEAAELFSEPVAEAGLGAFADQVEEALRTTGLLRWEDGSERPAWDSFVDALGDVRDAQNTDDHDRGHRADLTALEDHVDGSIEFEGDQDWVSWQAEAGLWRFTLTRQNDDFYNLEEGRLRLYDQDRSLLDKAQLDGRTDSAVIVHQADESAQMRLAVSGRDGDGGAWSLQAHALQKGTGDADRLRGGDDADWLSGKAGDDRLIGGDGNDTLDGGKNEDNLFGGKGRDTLWGGRNADLLRGGKGADELGGGRGSDHLQGGRGNDVISGSKGDDIIDGGKGQDFLDGGKDDDIFVFRDGDSDFDAPDTIKLLKTLRDRVQLDMDADLTTPGDQDFIFIGIDEFSGQAGEFRMEGDSWLQADRTGDGVADWRVEVLELNYFGNDFLL